MKRKFVAIFEEGAHNHPFVLLFGQINNWPNAFSPSFCWWIKYLSGSGGMDGCRPTTCYFSLPSFPFSSSHFLFNFKLPKNANCAPKHLFFPYFPFQFFPISFPFVCSLFLPRRQIHFQFCWLKKKRFTLFFSVLFQNFIFDFWSFLREWIFGCRNNLIKNRILKGQKWKDEQTKFSSILSHFLFHFWVQIVPPKTQIKSN